MFNTTFMGARTLQDWVIGLLIATHTAILVSLFIILFSR